MAHFNLKKQTNGQFYFTLHATGNNETLLKSEGYISKGGCQNGIASVKENAKYDSRYERKTTWNGSQYYFNLKAANGEVIATSEMYNGTYSRDQGIETVKNQAPTANTNDLA